MAAVTGHFNFWNLTGEEALQKAWLRVGHVKTISATVAVLAMIVSPVIVFGNSLVIFISLERSSKETSSISF